MPICKKFTPPIPVLRQADAEGFPDFTPGVGELVVIVAVDCADEVKFGVKDVKSLEQDLVSGKNRICHFVLPVGVLPQRLEV